MDDRPARLGRKRAPDPQPSAERPPPVEVRQLNKRYKNGPWANQDISLTVEWGEALGVMGPNGAGKTTLVRQITTELVPTSGQVRVLGIDAVTHPDEVKACIGVVPQEAQLFDGLSVHQHLRIFGKLRGLSRRDARQRADELIDHLDLERYRATTSSRLSGGLRRRLLVGIALLAEPDVLILDEPTVGLDVESRHGLWDVIRSYRERDAAVLLTTHYLEEAEALAQHVAVINHGTLVAEGTPRDVTNRIALRRVRFTAAAVPDIEPVAHGAFEAGIVTLYTPNSDLLVRRLIETRVAFSDLEVLPAGLEEAFVRLTQDDPSC